MPSFVLAVFAATQVHVNPNPKALPGSSVLQQLIDGLAFWMLLAAMDAAPDAPSVEAALATFEAFGDAYTWHALRPQPAGARATREVQNRPGLR